MNVKCCEAVTYTFKVLCYISAATITLFWLYRCYIVDDDLTLVDYVPVDSDEISSPVLSVCFRNRFSVEKLKEISSSLNASYYLDYLKGDAMDQDHTKISYEEVSMNISDHIVGYEIRLNNGTKIHYRKPVPYQNPYFTKSITYSGFFLSKDDFIKCIGHSVKKQYRRAVHSITTAYDFPNGFGKHYMSIHYPNQLLASIRNFRYFLNPTRDANETDFLRWFDVHEMEVFKRRNKKKSRCLNLEDQFGFDNYVQLKHDEKESYCRAPYQNYDNTRPICSTKEDMKKVAFIFNEEFEEKFNPCESMSNIRHEMQEYYVPGFKYYSIGMVFPNKVRVIQQSKAIDTNSLIGYVIIYSTLCFRMHIAATSTIY